MIITKETKRFTFFPKDNSLLSTEKIMEYITPMGALNFLPNVSKGYSVKFKGAQVESTEEAWTVDFNSSNQENIKVTVSDERIDILCFADLDWDEVLAKVKPVISLISANNPKGFNRIAIGSTFNGNVGNDEIEDRFTLFAQEAKEERVQDLMKRSVRLEEIPLEGREIKLELNDVQTLTLTRKERDWNFTYDVDINTIVKSDSKVVTESIDIIFNFGKKKIAEYYESFKG